MSLTVRDNGTVETALEDITVYKVLNRETNASTCYTPHTRYESAPLQIVPNRWELAVEEGFRAYTTSDKDVLMAALFKLVKFVIPAGAHFGRGQWDTIVSDVIIADDLEDVSCA